MDFNGLITVNEIGAFLWDMLQNDVALEDMVAGVLKEYDVEENVAKEDIQEFLNVLIEGGILAEDDKQ